MHILHLNFEFPPVIGGGAEEAFLLYQELSTRHQVSVITAEVQGYPLYERKGSIDVYRCPVASGWKGPGHVSELSLLSFLPSLIWTAKKYRKNIGKVDVLNAWFAIPTGVVSPWVAKIFRCPSVLTLCGGDVFDPTKKMAPNNNRLSRWAVKHALSQHDALTAISTDLANRATYDIGTKSPISVIPMGIAPRAQGPALFRKNPSPFKLLTVCRLVRRKGIDTVIAALAKQPSKNFQYDIVGDGPEKENLQRQARELGIADRVKFHGFVEKRVKDELYGQADAFVLVSLHEGQCQAVLEAAQAGLPILTGNVGGQTDMIKNRVNGLLASAGNVSEVAEALKELMSSSELRADLGKAVLESVKRYQIGAVADKYTALFESLVGANHFLKAS